MGWFGFYGLRVGFCSRKFFLGKLPEGGFLMTVVLRLICDFSFLSFFELFSVVFWGFDSAFVFCVWDVGKLREMVGWFVSGFLFT